MTREQNVHAFNQDARSNQGYLYSTNAKVSSVLSNARISAAVAKLTDVRGKRVIDVGCGDGAYTEGLLRQGAAFVLGVDAAHDAVALAQESRAVGPRLAFLTLGADELASLNERFDVAIVRGLLHHLYDAEKAVASICSIADEIVVVEPNGYNPILKVIEKVSAYHIAHEEKSYPPSRLDRWFERQGGTVEAAEYIGLVPFFCPEWMANFLKRLEPIVERLPVVRAVSCAQYVQRISMRRPQSAGLAR